MLSKPAKPLQDKFMHSWRHQPLNVKQYVNVASRSNTLLSMFTRLLIVLVSRGFLHAAELKYIAEGEYIPGTQYADWSPEKEIAEGRPIQSIKGV